MDEFLRELKESLDADAVKVVEQLEEKYKDNFEFARAAEKLGMRFLTLPSGDEKRNYLPSSFEPQQDLYIHCCTEEEAKNLLRHFHYLEYSWYAGDSLLERTYFNSYKSETCYGIHPDRKLITYTCYKNSNRSIPLIAFENIQAYMGLQKCDLKKHELEHDMEER